MEKFCGGESIWNTSLTWGDDRTYPGFTECFQNSVLIWIASGWLWLSLPFYLPYLLAQKSRCLPNTWKNLSKLCIAMLQLIIIVIELSYGASELNRKNETYFQAYFIGPAIEALTIILVMCYIEIERRKGLITSGVLFMYWLLANFTYIIPFYRKIIEKGYSDELLDFILFNVYFFLTLVQLTLSCIAETLPTPPEQRLCPESRASFISRLTYQWIQKLVVTGYRKPLTEEDMFALNPSEQSATVMNIFESHWRQQEIKTKQKLARKRNLRAHVHLGGSTNQDNIEISESTPLLVPHSSKSYDRSSDKSCDSDKDDKVSLPIVLAKTFGWDLIIGNAWKLIYDVLVFVNPFLLQLLIDFAVDSSKPTWKGYVYSGAFFLVISIQSFAFHFVMHKTMTIGIRIRSALISAVFKKSLRMNNQARTESTVGEIVNLMSVDAEHIKDVSGYLWGLWSSPLQIIGSIIYLYFTVGYAMFAGLGVMILLTPVNMVILSYVQKCETLIMEHKDERIKLTTEILNGIKILKLYAWEMAFGEKVTAIRNKELAVLLKGQILYCISIFSWTVAPFTVGLATFATYIYTQEDHKFDPQAAFVAMTLFNILRFALNIAPIMFMELIQAMVSIKRMGKFLNNKDLDFTNVSHAPSDNAIKVEDGTFSWDPEIGPCLKDIQMKVPKGSLVAVVGTVGAGKSSLMSAILGEMQKVNGTVNVDGSTAYVPQQAWIQNATIKDNIIFGQQSDNKKYRQIVEACALKNDLDILPAADMTEIGEKGINLSGGQKQRISLARAVYFDSDIYLLDDPLSAVDSHVGKHIFEEVIGKDGLLKQKTRVLVTHGIHWLPNFDMIFVISNGVISEHGTYDELLSHDGEFAKFLSTYLIEHEESDEEEEDEEAQNIKKVILQRLVSIKSESDGDALDVDHLENILVKRSRSVKISESEKSHREDHSKAFKFQMSVMSDKDSIADKAKLIEEEELEIGNVNLSVFLAYGKAVGYKSSLAIIILFGLYQAFSVWSSVWLTDWTSDEQLQITENLNWLVRMVSEFETNIVSVERVGQYTANPTEAALHTSEPPRKEWPDKGLVQLESYSTRYREGLSLVLKDISITINPGEKVGIVGRTGAGKSSLTLSLFRLIEPASGRILVDGQDVSHLGLYDLRSRLTILPQEPVLFSGSLRMNLDPLDENGDSAIWTALEHAHLKPFVDGLPTKLEYEVGEGGQNLSVGQRQLMCLARSLLRKSKILVLDEATAAVDLETDALIQNTINREFDDCTVLTIAHRLHTVIDYDRILVLSDGELQEFDSPKTLLQNTSSAFYAMAKDSGLV